jgi:hypothetical protein
MPRTDPRPWTRHEVDLIAQAWADKPEGCSGSPLFAVRFTPAGLSTFMEHATLDLIEAAVEYTPGPVTAFDVPVAPDTLLRRIEAHEATVAPTGGLRHADPIPALRGSAAGVRG